MPEQRPEIILKFKDELNPEELEKLRANLQFAMEHGEVVWFADPAQARAWFQKQGAIAERKHILMMIEACIRALGWGEKSSVAYRVLSTLQEKITERGNAQ